MDQLYTTFYKLYLEHTTPFESPSSFWKWSAFSAISAVIRDNLYIKYGDSNLYGNIYVLLLAGSAVSRKGRPVKKAESLVKQVRNTKVISGRTSIQAIIDELGRKETSEKDGTIVSGGSAIFFAEELAAALVTDPQAIGILTDLYDFKQEYKQTLRSLGPLRLENVVFSMFAASNEDLLKSVYDVSAMRGGLLGRTFLVAPSEHRPPNSLFRMPDMTTVEAELIHKLKQIAALKGRMTLTDPAIYEFEKWYKPFYESYAKRGDISGMIGRLHTGVCKVAMLLAANELSTVIDEHHMITAIEECIALIPNYAVLTLQQGKSDISHAGAIFMQTLYAQQSKAMLRSEVLRNCWQDIDRETLDNLVGTFEEGGLVRTVINRGSSPLYELTDYAINLLGSTPPEEIAKKKKGTSK